LSLTNSHHFWRSFAAYFLFVFAGPVLLTLFMILRLPAQQFEAAIRGMHEHAGLLGHTVSQAMSQSDDVYLESLAASYGDSGPYRLTLVATDGKVLGDSGINPDGMANVLNRPEIQLAMARGTGEAERFSTPLQQNLFYVAEAVYQDQAIVGYVRLGLDEGAIGARVKIERDKVSGIALLIIILMLIPAAILAWRRAAGLDVLTEVTEALAQGDFDRRVMESRVPGLKRLVDAINLMARNSARRVTTLTADRNRLATIFTGMVEGVIDVDQNQSIIHINDAAARLIGIRKETCIGKPVWQELRHQKVALALDEAINNRNVIKIQVEYQRLHGQLIMDIYIASLSDDQGKPIGAVLVLHDVTELKLLERVRTDFVANASHELKTPITAIRGLSETVVGDPDVDRGTLMHFMERIHAQSIRLSQLVTDLMTISRLESDQGNGSFTRINMNDLVSRALSAAEPSLNEKQHQLDQSLPDPAVMIFGDRQNLSQLVDNLIDNAIKYTPEKGRIQVRLSAEGDEMVLEVQDSGIGISPQYQERVFERFYRVDKARSQSLGGTGLGLSIVRNIAEKHGGEVSVKSQPGSGSVFYFRMQLADSQAS